VVMAFCSSRSRKFVAIAEGKPVLVGRDGVIYDDVLKRERVGIGDVEKTLRENDCALEDLKCAFLETDGTISIMKRG